MSAPPKPLKVLHINMHLGWGGQPNRILMTSRALRELGHEVWVSGPGGAILVERARKDGFRVFDDITLRRGFRPIPQFADLLAVRRLLKQERFDLIDTHGSQDTWAVAEALATLGGPRPAFVRTRHNIFPVSKNPANRWLYRRIDHVVTITPQVNSYLDGLLSPDQITAIPSVPDFDRFKVDESRESIRADLGFADDEQIVGVVARLAPEKGHDVLLRGVPAILEVRPNARFVFVGKGRSRNDIEALARSLGIDHAVRLLGFREDVPRILRALDLFVLPSTEGESLGTSILEAFLSGVPVVATDVGGVCESVRDRTTGLLVPSHSHEALAGAVIEQLTNHDRALQWAENGRNMVLSEFNVERLGRDTQAAYVKALQRR